MQISLRRRDEGLQVLRHVGVPDGKIVSDVGVVDDPKRDPPAGLPAVGVCLADDALHSDCRASHFSSSIGLRTSDVRPRGSGVHRMLRPALVALLPLSLFDAEDSR